MNPDQKSKAKIWAVRVCRYGLAALFLFTAIAKLAIVNAFVKNMGELLASSGFDYQRWSWPATIVVIGAEIVTAMLLILPRTVRIGALLAAVLLMGFAGYALYYVYGLHGEP
ncbi:MAG TPA: MauE/DoxX family redox-associated membrane protein, partial [Pyrinomonadaceae bacterium]